MSNNRSDLKFLVHHRLMPAPIRPDRRVRRHTTHVTPHHAWAPHTRHGDLTSPYYNERCGVPPSGGTPHHAGSDYVTRSCMGTLTRHLPVTFYSWLFPTVFRLRRELRQWLPRRCRRSCRLQTLQAGAPSDVRWPAC